MDKGFGRSREAERSACGSRICSFKQVAHYSLAFGEQRCRAAFCRLLLFAAPGRLSWDGDGIFLETAFFSPPLLFLFCCVLVQEEESSLVLKKGIFVKLHQASQMHYWTDMCYQLFPCSAKIASLTERGDFVGLFVIVCFSRLSSPVLNITHFQPCVIQTQESSAFYSNNCSS